MDELATTVDSGNVPAGVLAPTEVGDATVHQFARAARRRTALIAASALAVATIGVFVALFALRRPARQELDRERLRSVASQLTSGGDVLLDGKRYRVDLTQTQLHAVKFEVDEHPYEAIEQNPNKHSRWAQLAREGHRVIQFKDLTTNNYIAVVVDGVPRRATEAEADER